VSDTRSSCSTRFLAGRWHAATGHAPWGPSEDQGSASGELVIWRDLYERERGEREDGQAQAQELREQLVAIANAGPIRARRLRQQLSASIDATAASSLASSDPVTAAG